MCFSNIIFLWLFFIIGRSFFLLRNQLYKDLLEKSNESKVVSEFETFDQKGQACPVEKSRFFLVFANKPIVYLVGELADGRSVAVAVGISDMLYVTGDM